MAHISHTHRHKCVNRLKEDREGVDFHLWKFQLWYFKLYLLDEILLLVLRLWTLSGRAALQQDLFETLGQNINLLYAEYHEMVTFEVSFWPWCPGTGGGGLVGAGGTGTGTRGTACCSPHCCCCCCCCCCINCCCIWAAASCCLTN